MLLPTAAGNPSSMIAQALSIYKTLQFGSSGGRIPSEPDGTIEENKTQNSTGTEAIDTTPFWTSSIPRASNPTTDTSEKGFSLAKPHKDE